MPPTRVVLEVEVYSLGVAAVAHVADHFTGPDLTVSACLLYTSDAADE